MFQKIQFFSNSLLKYEINSTFPYIPLYFISFFTELFTSYSEWQRQTSAGTARVEDPFFSGGSRKGRKTKNLTPCDNVFRTNIMLARSRALRKRPL